MTLQEQNQKQTMDFQIKITEADIKRTAESYGIKDWQNILNMKRPDFSVRQFREGAYQVSRKLNEAQSELQWGQLLRAGVQNTFNQIYQAVPVTYNAVVNEVASNKRQEFYSPLERIGFPKRVGNGDNYPETNFKGLDIELINHKYGMMLAVEKELIDDDMTGQIVSRAAQMGENARLYEEAYVWARMMNDVGATLDGEALPMSQTYGTPYSSAGIHTGGFGINATTAARVSQSQIQAAWVLAQGMKDQSGRPMMVMPKYLACSPIDIFFVRTLLNSQANPSMVSTASADIGKVGSINSINPLLDLGLQPLSSRFIKNYGCLMIDPKAFAFQRRDPQEVVQENPQSGPAFSQDIFRYKTRARWEADFIDPKFIINLNTSFAST